LFCGHWLQSRILFFKKKFKKNFDFKINGIFVLGFFFNCIVPRTKKKLLGFFNIMQNSASVALLTNDTGVHHMIKMHVKQGLQSSLKVIKREEGKKSDSENVTLSKKTSTLHKIVKLGNLVEIINNHDKLKTHIAHSYAVKKTHIKKCFKIITRDLHLREILKGIIIFYINMFEIEEFVVKYEDKSSTELFQKLTQIGISQNLSKKPDSDHLNREKVKILLPILETIAYGYDMGSTVSNYLYLGQIKDGHVFSTLDGFINRTDQLKKMISLMFIVRSILLQSFSKVLIWCHSITKMISDSIIQNIHDTRTGYVITFKNEPIRNPFDRLPEADNFVYKIIHELSINHKLKEHDTSLHGFIQRLKKDLFETMNLFDILKDNGWQKIIGSNVALIYNKIIPTITTKIENAKQESTKCFYGKCKQPATFRERTPSSPSISKKFCSKQCQSDFYNITSSD
jgi:hypothetical protein